ncbi:hypothetical protein L6164_033283 [Bauhinia variegata]|uniref:Uncharacterized protein n=1 Tax=Bauhinia variegata TaxID=167791 RepID=A0ACB9KRC4_BAUVA|nr:hypothetical protein L6164_033283 [Bauhinia variegata]
MEGSSNVLFYSFFCLLALLTFTFLFKSSTKTPTPPSPRALPIIGHLHLMGSTMYKSFQKLAHLYGPLLQLRVGASTFVVVPIPKLQNKS